MKSPAAFIVLLALIFVAIVVLKRIRAQNEAGNGDDAAWPVKARKTLLNANEQIVFNRLTEAFPDWIVMAQVALSQVVFITGTDKRTSYQNRINQKVLDCVICRPDTSVVAVVEIDGNSHDSPRRSQSDLTKERVLSTAGIKLIRINSKNLPNGQQLRELIGEPSTVSRLTEATIRR